MRALTRWMSASPPSPRPHVGLATVLADEGKIDEALTEVNEALRLAPNNIDARQRLAAIYLQQGNWQAAAGVCRQLVDQAPERADGHVGLGLALSKTGD